MKDAWWPPLWLCVGLDLFGVLLGALLAAQLRHHNPALVLQADGVVFGLGFLLLAWFLGGYSFLRWPWMPYRQLVQRWLLVVGAALALAVLVGWLLNAALTAVWFHRSTLLILGLVLAFWGLLTRRWLQPLARRQAALRLARSPVVRRRSRLDAPIPGVDGTPQRQLLLLLVAYHPSPLEVEQLQACLADLSPEVGYAVVVNDHQPGEPVEQLAASADLFLTNRDNPGYGRGIITPLNLVAGDTLNHSVFVVEAAAQIMNFTPLAFRRLVRGKETEWMGTKISAVNV